MERRRQRRPGARGLTYRPNKDPRYLRRIRALLYPEPEFEYERPKTRADCLKMSRPCPFVSCRHHLYIDTKHNENIKFNFPDKEPWDLERSCALDLTDGGPMKLDDVGAAMNLTRERIRQIQEEAIEKAGLDIKSVREAMEEYGVDRRSCFRLLDEAEMEVLRAARRLAEIEREIEDLKQERRQLISQMDAIAQERLDEKDPPLSETDPPSDETNRADRETNGPFSEIEAWILSILQGGQWVPTRRMSSTMPSEVAGDGDPSKLVQKAIRALVTKGLIERGKPGEQSRSWRLVTP